MTTLFLLILFVPGCTKQKCGMQKLFSRLLVFAPRKRLLQFMLIHLCRNTLLNRAVNCSLPQRNKEVATPRKKRTIFLAYETMTATSK